MKRSLDRSKLIVSEAEPETFADAALFSNQRSGRVVGDVGADVHHDLRRQRDVHERILFPSRCLEVVWIVQRLRRHRNGSRKMAGLNQALRLSEGKSRSLISLFQRPTGIDFGIDSGLSSDFPFVLHFLSSSSFTPSNSITFKLQAWSCRFPVTLDLNRASFEKQHSKNGVCVCVYIMENRVHFWSEKGFISFSWSLIIHDSLYSRVERDQENGAELSSPRDILAMEGKHGSLEIQIEAWDLSVSLASLIKN